MFSLDESARHLPSDRDFRVASCCFLLEALSLTIGARSEARLSVMTPRFSALVETQFDIKHVGGAMRVGRNASGAATVPELGVGARMPPYEFYAKPKGSAGDYTLYLTFEPIKPPRSDKFFWQVTVREKLPTD